VISPVHPAKPPDHLFSSLKMKPLTIWATKVQKFRTMRGKHGQSIRIRWCRYSCSVLTASETSTVVFTYSSSSNMSNTWSSVSVSSLRTWTEQRQRIQTGAVSRLV
jgi:hypothetical protein